MGDETKPREPVIPSGHNPPRQCETELTSGFSTLLLITPTTYRSGLSLSCSQSKGFFQSHTWHKKKLTWLIPQTLPQFCWKSLSDIGFSAGGKCNKKQDIKVQITPIKSKIQALPSGWRTGAPWQLHHSHEVVAELINFYCALRPMHALSTEVRPHLALKHAPWAPVGTLPLSCCSVLFSASFDSVIKTSRGTEWASHSSRW